MQKNETFIGTLKVFDYEILKVFVPEPFYF